MNVFFDLVAQALAVIYAVTNNYALAIIGLTLIIMIIVTPLTLKGTRSMMVMQQLQPEMKKIQTQYKDDRQKLNEELLKFYKENDISPLGGCLPLVGADAGVHRPVPGAAWSDPQGQWHGLRLRLGQRPARHRQPAPASRRRSTASSIRPS